jgi:hypothetical protein
VLERVPDLEALRAVVRGEVPLAVQANRASDMLAAIRVAEEFKLKQVLLGGSANPCRIPCGFSACAP